MTSRSLKYLQVIAARSTPLDLPLLLFVLSALVGLWASYDPAISWFQLVALVGAVLIYSIIARLRTSFRATDAIPKLEPGLNLLFACAWSCVLFSVFVTLYFVTQHSFMNESVKFPIIERIGLFFNQVFTPFAPMDPQPDSVAGILEIGLMLNVAVIWTARNRSRQEFFVAAICMVLITFGLIMTRSRGAWLGLGAAGATLGVGYLSARSQILKPLYKALVYCIPVALLVFLAVWLIPRGWEDLFQARDGYFARVPLYVTTLSLMRDYVFTGGGLGTFKMVHSTYYLLIQGGLLPHAQNLYLQIWYDQGLLGIVAFLWAVVALFVYAWRRRRNWNAVAVAGLAGTMAILVHGLLDAPFWYSTDSLLVLFLPMAFAVAALDEPKESKGFYIDRHILLTNCVMVGLIALGLVIQWKPLASLWYANLGDVAQTKLELSRYHFPEVLVEYVRRSGDYTLAESYWQQALALDPGNVPANQRWGELFLARGEYAHAAQLLEAAYARDPASPVTSQLLGAAYLGMGQMDNAYHYWVRLPDAVERLESEAWVRYETNGDKVRAGWALALARRILDERLAQP